MAQEVLVEARKQLEMAMETLKRLEPNEEESYSEEWGVLILKAAEFKATMASEVRRLCRHFDVKEPAVQGQPEGEESDDGSQNDEDSEGDGSMASESSRKRKGGDDVEVCHNEQPWLCLGHYRRGVVLHPVVSPWIITPR